METTTLTIKLKNPKALTLLEDLEALGILKIIKKPVSKGIEEIPITELLAGITSEEAEEMRRKLRKLRDDLEKK